MAKLYVGSQEHFEDEINAYYKQKEEMGREMQKQYEKDMMEQMERDYYEQSEQLVCPHCKGLEVYIDEYGGKPCKCTKQAD